MGRVRAVAARRAARAAPYSLEHQRSIALIMERERVPRTLPELLRWYLAEWAAEIPDRIHASDVWRDYGLHAVGGSLLGSPRDDDAFRRYLYDPPWSTDALPGEDESGAAYLRPVHFALSRMARSSSIAQRDSARLLFAIASSGGDWHGVLSSGSWRRPRCPVLAFQEVIARDVLRQFYRDYRRRPSDRVVE